MIILHSSPASFQRSNLPYIQTITHTNYYPPFSTVTLPFRSYHQPMNLLYAPKPSRSQTIKAQDFDFDIDIDADVVDDAVATDDDDEFSPRGGFRRDEDEKDYDRDPEFAEILGSCLDDPEKAQSKMEERLRSKRNKILHTKTGSALPMNVIFNKFGFSNSYIWFEFYNAPLGKDISLICNTIRSWHIVGRLGGCNSMNMQLSQSLLDKRPSYDAIQGANVTPTTFYNIGDLEIQDNLARIWVDIGTSEPLLLDVLINALTQISSDYIGIKQLVFGGSEFENWKENMTSEAAGYNVHLIQTITNLLTSPKPQLQNLTQYIPHLTPPLIFTILSSKSLSSHPTNLLSFFKWSQTHLPFFSSTALPSLLALLSSLFRHNKFPDAKSLLVDFISVDQTNTLHHSILHPSRFYPEPSKALYDTAIGAYIHSGKPHLAAQIFKNMKRLRLCPNLLTCNTLLISLVRFPSSHSVSMSREIFNDVVRLGVIPNATTFNILINGYCLENKFKEALEVLRSMGGYQCTPDVVSYNTILDALCKKGRLSEARDLLLDMKNRGLLPKRNTYNILVYGYCKLGWLKDAAKVIELMTLNNVLPDIWTYNMLISGFCNDGRIDEAIRLRDEMVSMKLMPDVVTYNTLINACFEWRDSSEASKLLDEMLEKGVKQNAVTQNILVKWYCKEGKMDEASDTVRKMEENGFSPDCVTYNTLINGYCKAGNLGEAFRIMLEMGRKGLKMDGFTLNTFLHILCGERKLKEAYSLLNSARNRGYVLDEVSYGTLIMGYFKDENVENALKIWDEMKEKEIIPGIVTYNTIIGGLCQSGRSEQAITKLNELLENGLFPDETTYNTIIHGYCLEGEVENAFQFHNKMVENSFKPDVFTCNILLRGLCREGMLEKALKLFNTWISKGKVIDTVTYNTLISSLCKEGKLEEAFDLLVEMEEKKLGPDHYTVNYIFSALTDAGKIKEAEEFMSKMTETGKWLDQSLQMNKRHELASSETPQETDETSKASSERISELCTEGRYKDAMLIFEDMMLKGISVNKSTYITLMDGLIKRRKSITKAAQQ